MSVKRVYDRLTPPPLAAHRVLELRGTPRFLTMDLSADCGPIKDQGAEGACTAHAGAEACEWIFRRYFSKTPIFSPQYTYAQELIATGDFPNDVGSDGVTLCGTLITRGCCEEALYPYKPGNIARPDAAQDANAAKWRLGAYHGLSGSETALSVLADPTPWPVLIGFLVYPSFESDETAETGVMPLPGPGATPLGGHEVMMIGYDVEVNPVLRPAGSPPAAYVQNSWGAGWGLGGRFWMPLAVLNAPETDLKIAHSGRPW